MLSFLRRACQIGLVSFRGLPGEGTIAGERSSDIHKGKVPRAEAVALHKKTDAGASN